jgi:hypothetical protein
MNRRLMNRRPARMLSLQWIVKRIGGVAILILGFAAMGQCDEYTIQLDKVSSGFDKVRCWVHPRAGIIPGNPPSVVLTMNHLLLTGSDVYYEINDMRSNDLGKTWTGPTPHPKTLGRRTLADKTEITMCDFWPAWHAKSGKLLGIGHTVQYENNAVMHVRNRHTAFSVYDPEKRTWTAWATMEMPDEPRFKNAGAGSSQRYDLPSGEILLPIYFKEPKNARYSVTIVVAKFDGEKLGYVRHGDEISVDGARGLSESSITKFGDRYFVTLRSDECGYVVSSADGLHFDQPRKWTFDDGSDLGNYNTQQHWVTHSDALYLVYNRRGAKNDHVFRHRAPLFIAQVDPERLCVLRDTEKIVVPERGARLGNFGVVNVNEDETWVTTAEWMQTTGPDPRDFRVPMKYGADNSVYAARILWKKPNRLVQK